MAPDRIVFVRAGPAWITHQCCMRYGTLESAGRWQHFDVDRVKKSSSKAITELSVEMVEPRFAVSILTGGRCRVFFHKRPCEGRTQIKSQLVNGKQSG